MKSHHMLNLGEAATVLLQQERELRPASYLLHVQVPGRKTRYIPYARNYQGYVVQCRYQGVGIPRYTQHESFALIEHFDAYLPYWQPVLNPLAVAQAGLDPATILAWVAANPGSIFQHPTYTRLYLRWKKNTHEITLTVPPGEDFADDAVYFTPHTCQLTGTTYYKYIATQEHSGEVLRALKMRAGLTYHEREQGAEGIWSGLYGIDRIHLETVLTTLGYRFELAQLQVLHYAVARPSKTEVDLLTYYDLPEQALAHFARLPALSSSAPSAAIYPLGQVGWVELLNGELLNEQTVARKPLDWEAYSSMKEWCADGAGEQVTNGNLLSLLHLPATDVPLPRLIPTLRSLLAATGYPRYMLATWLNCTEDTICQWEQQPLSMSLFEVQRIAEILTLDVAALTALLHEESVVKATMN